MAYSIEAYFVEVFFLEVDAAQQATDNYLMMRHKTSLTESLSYAYVRSLTKRREK